MNKVVLGANFGDEGKGLMTDYFVSQFNSKCFVVRFNGGAQAGHTVVTPEGRRHKFSHFGSGSLQGAPTYLSKYFILNPLLFMKELNELDFLPKVYVDRDCLVSTPYDMFVNQATEAARGDRKHGSCGMGIGETIERSDTAYCFEARDLLNSFRWRQKLQYIAEQYYPKRMQDLGQVGPDFDHDKFVIAFEDFISRITICDLQVLQNQDLVFEGAQGLLLDQNHPYFPHVTRSNTGFQNAGAILADIGKSDNTEVVYVTRSYLTRHGRGPFPTEIEEIDTLPYIHVVDDTNVFNEFQEGLRFGVIDLPNLCSTIEADILKNDIEKASIAVTCLDQVDDGMVKHCSDANLHLTCRTPVECFLAALSNRLPFWKIYSSFGKTRATVTGSSSYSLKLSA